MTRSEEDAQLVARAVRGDLEAFDALVTRHQRQLMARALASTGRLEDADDLVQESFVRAFENLAALKEPEAFGSWLRTIHDRLAVDRSRRRKTGAELRPALGAQLPDEAPDPEQRLLSLELAEQVKQALACLPPGRQREIFRMRYQEGLPIQEIAERLGVHTGTVKVHLFRSARALRRHLGTSEGCP